MSYLDDDMRKAITSYFKRIGIKLVLNTEVKSIEKKRNFY